ncbi:transposase [Streptomyces sp. NPDC007901]|uniref:transposase n=1 Tax=Streptomyces sp. NPDC007901 TaxID=3364785 RepID=UPI0036E8F8E8
MSCRTGSGAENVHRVRSGQDRQTASASRACRQVAGSDLTDAEWQVVRPLLPVSAWLQGRGGRPESYCHRVMLDAMCYVVDNGVKWASLPAGFPPYRRVHAFTRRWQATGLLGEFHDRLREGEGRPRRGPAGRDHGLAVRAGSWPSRRPR